MKLTIIIRNILLLSLLVLVLFCVGCKEKKSVPVSSSSSCEIHNGDSEVLTVENFLRIKEFVLSHGDRQNCGNAFNNNPHYRFSEFDLCLNPENGQENINCDPNLSDFNQMVFSISEPSSGNSHYYITVPSAEKDLLCLQRHYVQITDDVLKASTEEYFQKMLTEIEDR